MSEHKYLNAWCPKCKGRALKKNVVSRSNEWGECYVLHWHCPKCHDVVTDNRAHRPQLFDRSSGKYQRRMARKGVKK